MRIRALLSIGLALCTLHHKLFDRGAFTLSLDEQPQIVVAARVTGTGSFAALLLDLQGSPLRLPYRGEDRPAERFIAWHHEAVFGSIDQARPPA